MPYLIGDNLVIGILHHITDFCRLNSLIDLLNGYSIKQNLPLFLAMRSKNGFQLPQKRGLAAAGLTTQNNIFALFDGQAHTIQGLFTFGGGI